LLGIAAFTFAEDFAAGLPDRTGAGLDFFIFTDLGAALALAFGAFLLAPFEGFVFFGITRVGQLITSPPHASQVSGHFSLLGTSGK
jgi:hypothetical protein